MFTEGMQSAYQINFKLQNNLFRSTIGAVLDKEVNCEREGVLGMKKAGMVILGVVMIALAGCGTRPEEENVGRENTYPGPDEVAASLEAAGFELERSENFEQLEISTTRIKAVNGEEYLDICYEVSSAEDMNRIEEYYEGSYSQYNILSDDEMICCYSSESALQNAGLQ